MNLSLTRCFQDGTWSEECEPGLACVGTAAAPFETSGGTGACRPTCDVEADDCDLDTSCAAFAGAGFGACVPPG